MNIISLGAGVQSSTMALMAAHGEIGPMPDCAIFADTQAEPKSVYTWLDWLEKQLPFPVYRVTKGSLTDDSLVIHTSKKSGNAYIKSLIPAFVQQKNGNIGLLGRKCTANYKVDMIMSKAKQIGQIKRGQKDVGIIQWIGISSDEAHRMKPSRVPWSKNIWPLIDKNMSRSDCLKWMSSHNYPPHPRSACVYCPFHSDAEWRRLKNDDPVEFSKAAQFEKNLQHAATQQTSLTGVPWLTRRCVPLEEIDFRNAEDAGQLSMFGNECEGMCGV